MNSGMTIICPRTSRWLACRQKTHNFGELSDILLYYYMSNITICYILSNIEEIIYPLYCCVLIFLGLCIGIELALSGLLSCRAAVGILCIKQYSLVKWGVSAVAGCLVNNNLDTNGLSYLYEMVKIGIAILVCTICIWPCYDLLK